MRNNRTGSGSGPASERTSRRRSSEQQYNGEGRQHQNDLRHDYDEDDDSGFQSHYEDENYNPDYEYENEYQSGPGLYGDVIVRFYEDAEQEIPAYVTSLVVNFRVIGYNGWSGYDYYDAMTANGDYLVIATNAEHDYDDGETFRYRDYHLQPGDYVDL